MHTSKTDPFHRGVKLCLSITDSHICLIKVLLLYLALEGKQPGPLFTMQGGSPLMCTSFKNSLSTTLRVAGLDDSQYNSHSFRISAATSAKVSQVCIYNFWFAGEAQHSKDMWKPPPKSPYTSPDNWCQCLSLLDSDVRYQCSSHLNYRCASYNNMWPFQRKPA